MPLTGDGARASREFKQELELASRIQDQLRPGARAARRALLTGGTRWGTALKPREAVDAALHAHQSPY
jgi:hypothetical protein